jgi:prephenate dehydrogenase
MREHVMSVWEILSQAYGRIGLYGAGAHTTWLLKELNKSGAKVPCLIFDDQPTRSQLNGIPLLKTGSEADVDAIVVSSDAHAEVMYEKACSIWKNGISVINLYSAFKDPVFRK